MATLKKLHENLIKQEIKRNYFLNMLNEAINIGNVKAIIDPIEKMESIVKQMNFISLNFAFERALADAKKIAVIKDNSLASELVTKITVFYSKIWNFLSKDLPILKRINLKDFFENAEPDDRLAGHKDASEIKKIIREALIEDNSPWYRIALAYIRKDSSWVSAIPYLNIDSFVNEFMSMEKKELEESINITKRIKGSPFITDTDEIDSESDTKPEGSKAVTDLVLAVDKLVDELKTKFPDIADKITRKKVAELLFVKNKTFSSIEESDFVSVGDIF
ncbi:hypothetical protein EBU95_14470 [bacterium]|nr:hypothetical protein [bacterium]